MTVLPAPVALGFLEHQNQEEGLLNTECREPSGVSDSVGQSEAREPACLTTGDADAAGPDGTSLTCMVAVDNIPK